MKRVIGIDLGTGNSGVATIENGKPVMIINSEGYRTTPSIISLKNGERKIGEAARRQRVISPKETISLIKRFMGVDYDKCDDILKHITYDVVNNNNKPRIVVEGREYSPEELSSFILAKMKKTAEDYIGEKVEDAVITCPAWFDNAAREATKLAGEMAGLKVHRIINEPTAAILASNIKTDGSSKLILVADIGCGTTDFSLCEISDGMVEVLASKGDVFLGGSDFDNAIAKYIIDTFEKENNVSIKNDVQAVQRIIEAAEKAKIELSSSLSTEVNLPYIMLKDNQPLHLAINLTRSKLEQLTHDLVSRIINCAKEAVNAASIDKNKIDAILLVGGQSRSIAIKEALIKEFGDKLNQSVNPDEAVALGAAVQANIIVGDGDNDIVLLDVTPISMGIETMGGVFTKLIDANTTIPCRKTEIFSTATDNQSVVDIHVLQGERPLAKDNKSIGLFRLDGIMPAQRGVPQIEVSFDIDANGILKVTAKDKATNKEQSITIESKGNLTEEEINRIKKEAEEFAESDKIEEEKIKTVNKGENIIFNTENLLKQINDKISEEDKKSINDKLSSMKNAINEKDIEKINSIETELNTLLNTISETLYSNANNNNQNTSDSNFEEVK